MLKAMNFDEGSYSTVVYSGKIGKSRKTKIIQPLLIYRVNQLGTSFRNSSYRRRALMLTSDDNNSRSKSVNDLTEYQYSEERAKCSTRINLERLIAVPNRQWNYSYRTGSGIEKEAGRCISRALIINAWRCRRRDSEEAAETVRNLTNQMESLNIQIYVLKQLLHNEKVKREAAAIDAQSYLLKTEEYERENKIVLEEKESLEIKFKELLNTVIELKDECENRKKDFTTFKKEAELWKFRCNQEEKKSKSLGEENMILQKDCLAKEEELIYRIQRFNELCESREELERQLDSQIRLLNDERLKISAAEEKLKLSEEFKMKQKMLLTTKEDEINGLKAQIALMEEKLHEQDERNGELGKLISDKTKELLVVNEKLKELTKAQKFWGNRIIKIASVCTRIPIACFYTVATFLLPQPSYRVL